MAKGTFRQRENMKICLPLILKLALGRRNDSEKYYKIYKTIIQPILDSQSIGYEMTKEIVQKTLDDISHKAVDRMVIPYGIEHTVLSSSCHFFSQDRKVDDCFLEEDDEPVLSYCYIYSKAMQMTVLSQISLK